MSKKHPPINDPYYDRLHLFLRSTNHETDRGRALVIASLIEEMLEEILRSFLLDTRETKALFDSANAPLSSLSAKSLLCRSLGLITIDEHRDIDKVRRIRNEFAHSVMCSFEKQKISDLSTTLKVGMSVLDELPEGHKSRVDDPKSRFMMVATSIVTSLYNRAHYVRKQRIKDTQHPS